MILETDRLILRKYVEEDFDALFECFRRSNNVVF